MFNHIMVGSNDIERSEQFYNAVLAVLGAGAPMKSRSPSGHMRLFYRHAGNTFCVSEPIGLASPFLTARTPAITVVLTAPRPTSRMPSFPEAGAIVRGFTNRTISGRENDY